ncbi:hypothetical protein K8I61_18815 [bacterium]|nr:hypothetical protein [bacterium]
MKALVAVSIFAAAILACIVEFGCVTSGDDDETGDDLPGSPTDFVMDIEDYCDFDDDEEKQGATPKAFDDPPPCGDYKPGKRDFEIENFENRATSFWPDPTRCVASVNGLRAVLTCELFEELDVKITWLNEDKAFPISNGQTLYLVGDNPGYEVYMLWLFDENFRTVLFELTSYSTVSSIRVGRLYRTFEFHESRICEYTADAVQPGHNVDWERVYAKSLGGRFDCHKFSVDEPNGRALTDDRLFEVNVVNHHAGRFYEPHGDCGEKRIADSEPTCGAAFLSMQVTAAE